MNGRGNRFLNSMKKKGISSYLRQLPCVFAVMCLLLTCCSGCVKKNPLEEDGNGGQTSGILTQANHSTGWEEIDCFISEGCHRDGSIGYDKAHGDTLSTVCTNASCHGNNGVYDRALIWGTAFDQNGIRKTGVTVIGRNQSSPGQIITSLESDLKGEFTLVVTSTGLYEFEITDGTSDTLKAADFGMGAQPLDYQEGLACAECHGTTEPEIYFD
jgi:hypothetical protein